MECWKTVQLLRARVDAGRALFIPAGETIEVITSQGLTPRVFWRGCKEALDGLQVNASDLFAKAQWIGQSPRAD